MHDENLKQQNEADYPNRAFSVEAQPLELVTHYKGKVPESASPTSSGEEPYKLEKLYSNFDFDSDVDSGDIEAAFDDSDDEIYEGGLDWNQVLYKANKVSGIYLIIEKQKS